MLLFLFNKSTYKAPSNVFLTRILFCQTLRLVHCKQTSKFNDILQTKKSWPLYIFILFLVFHVHLTQMSISGKSIGLFLHKSLWLISPLTYNTAASWQIIAQAATNVNVAKHCRKHINDNILNKIEPSNDLICHLLNMNYMWKMEKAKRCLYECSTHCRAVICCYFDYISLYLCNHRCFDIDIAPYHYFWPFSIEIFTNRMWAKVWSKFLVSALWIRDADITHWYLHTHTA